MQMPQYAANLSILGMDRRIGRGSGDGCQCVTDPILGMKNECTTYCSAVSNGQVPSLHVDKFTSCCGVDHLPLAG